jgi:hypothetical protein
MAGSTDEATQAVLSGALWSELCRTLEAAREQLRDPDFPDDPADEPEYLRYLLRFFASGIESCIEHQDPDHPEFTRMMDLNRRWGLDSPDHLYLFAPVCGENTYRIHGEPGTANLVDLQVNEGHFALGSVGAVRTIGSLALDDMVRERDGSLVVTLGGGSPGPNHIALTEEARFVQVRQVFADWEREQPADLVIERVGGPVLRPRVDAGQIHERIELLRTWMTKGGALWRDMSKLMLSLPPNTLRIPDVEQSGEQGGLKGQAYGLGCFACEPDEAVILEWQPPPCRHWSVSLATWWWEAIDFAARQSSLNHTQAQLDSDGRFRGVIAHQDPGVPNWLDAAGHRRGTLIARFVLAERAPEPSHRVVKLADLRDALPADTPEVSPADREAVLERRRYAVWRRFRR